MTCKVFPKKQKSQTTTTRTPPMPFHVIHRFARSANQHNSHLESQIKSHSLQHLLWFQFRGQCKCMSDVSLIHLPRLRRQISSASSMDASLVTQWSRRSHAIIHSPLTCANPSFAQPTVCSHSGSRLLVKSQSSASWYGNRTKARDIFPSHVLAINDLKLL
jgi:hypothetical protein